MNWHYLENGQQLGPVTEEQFTQLVQQGVILPDTFIWCKGMEKWQRYGELVPAAAGDPTLAEKVATAGGLHMQHSPSDAPAATREVSCSQCGVVVPVSQIVNFGSAQLCPQCQDARARMMATGWGGGPVEYANPFLRLGAFFLDGLIADAVLLMVAFGVIFVSRAFFKDNKPVLAGTGLFIVVFALWWLLNYFVSRIANEGQTPAMKWMKIRVTEVGGGNISWWRSLGRFLVIGLINNFTLGLGHLVALFDKQKRSLHGIICGTIVIKS